MINLRDFDKETRSELAAVFNAHIRGKYEREINDCVKHSKIYNRGDLTSFDPTDDGGKIRSSINLELVETDTVTCLFQHHHITLDDVAILNFASFKNPGGMFLSGSSAQEESLCHQSILYPVLEAFTDNFYAPHNTTKGVLNNGLYQDELIYSKGVKFLDHDVVVEVSPITKKRKITYKFVGDATADVITCAAPNAKVYLRRKYGDTHWQEHLWDGEVVDAMRKRLDTAIRSAIVSRKRNIILGAFGCGVFGNSPEMVAYLIHKNIWFEGIYQSYLKNVYVAVPRIIKDDPNFSAFEKRFWGAGYVMGDYNDEWSGQ